MYGDNTYGLCELETCSEASEEYEQSMNGNNSYTLLEIETCGEAIEECEQEMCSVDAHGLLEVENYIENSGFRCSRDFNPTSSSNSGVEYSVTSHPCNSLWQIQDCCSQRCIAAFSPLELENIQSVFNSKNQQEQRQFMVDQVAVTPTVSHTSTNIPPLSLNGKMVCKRAFIRILGTSHARLTRVFTAWDVGVRRLISRKRKPRCLSAKHTTMAAWLDVYSQQIGEKMPHLDQVHLPHFLTKKAVYQIMKSKQGVKSGHHITYDDQ